MKRQEKYPNTSTFHYYNANPKNKITGDCWCRAICTALEIPYNQVVMEMAELHCKTGKDCPIDDYLKSKGWIKHKQPRKADNTKYTGKEFCQKLNSDIMGIGIKVIANIGGHHIVCIKEDEVEGLYKIHDIWNSTEKCIGNYWIKG